MSLASLLLGSKPSGKKKAIDTELDDIFHSQTTSNRPEDHPVAKKQKRRLDAHTNEPGNKRPKPSLANAISSPSPPAKKKSEKNRVRFSRELVSEPDTFDASHAESSRSIYSHFESETSDDDGDDPSTLIHETIQKERSSKPSGRKAKYAPSDETKECREARTIFIGNLAPDVAIKRPLQKQLHRHICSFLPTAKIESTRFRSVAFQAPTSKLPEAEEGVKKTKQPRQHDRDRASSWRNAQGAGDESKTDEKKFLTPSQKKKIAFINKGVHSDANSVHAYIVFAYPPPPHSRPANLPPLSPVMDPFEASRLAIEKCNGTIFLDRMIRVDAVVKKLTAEGLPDSTLLSSAAGNPKLTVFVGNLDFTSKEDDLRLYFEGIVGAARGPPDTEGTQDGNKPKCWVTRVRMIRDKETQLGKGFAYVQFSDRTCVDEIIALEPGKLKFAKRKLRVQRCKSIPNPTSVKKASPSEPAKTPKHTVVPPVPKGDPSLGEKLVELSKEERKRVKATDADRVARRMAKKKARMALAKQGVPVQSKQRDRVRKSSVSKKPGSAPLKKASKGRVRSDKSIAKRNTKK